MKDEVRSLRVATATRPLVAPDPHHPAFNFDSFAFILHPSSLILPP